MRVEVRNASGDVASNTDRDLRHSSGASLFTVNLSFATRDQMRAATRSTKRPPQSRPRRLYGTGYRLKIKTSDGTEVCSTSSSSQCGPRTVTVGQTYRAVVEDSQGRNFGQSGAWTLTDSGSQSATVEDLDLAALAAAAGGIDICTRLGLSPYKTNVAPPSTSGGDQWEACEEAVAAGATTLAILLAVAETPGGLENLWWLRSDTQRTAPAPETTPTEDDATAPRPVPLPWLPDVNSLAQTLTLLNRDLPQDWADNVANQCLFLMARAGQNGLRECSRLPIFASGDDVSEATNHDLEALAFHFPWVELNYEFGETKRRGRVADVSRRAARPAVR